MKLPSSVAKFMFFCLIYSAKMRQGMDKTGIHTWNQWIIKRGKRLAAEYITKTLRYSDAILVRMTKAERSVSKQGHLQPR